MICQNFLKFFVTKRKITNKTKNQILISEMGELSYYEKEIRIKLFKNPKLSLKEAVESIIENSDQESDFKEIDMLLFPDERELICRKIKFLLKIIIVSFLASIIIEFAFLLLSYIIDYFKLESIVFSNGVWLYYGLIGIVSFFAFMKLSEYYDFMYLLTQKIILSIIIGLLSWIIGFNQNITSSYGKILMFDDTEYVEGYDDVDPLWGGSSGGYVGDYQYFISESDFVDGIFHSGEIEFRFDGGKVEMIESEFGGSIFYTKRIRYWQYAYCEGYKPLTEKFNVESKSGLYKMFKVTPKYFLEHFINKGVKGIGFAIYILVLVIFLKDKVTIKKT